MKRQPLELAAALALIAALLMAAGRVQAARERNYPVTEIEEETLTIRSAALVRRLSLAYSGLAADLYWIRAIQYYGGTTRKLQGNLPDPMPPASLVADPAVDFPLLYPLLDVTTTLDPRFNVAYRFGALFLADLYPTGPGRPDLAIALLAKGLRDRPDKWEYMQDIGFVHYWYRHDYAAAAEWFDKASRAPTAPWWLKSLAATTLAKGGDRGSSRQMWTAIRESADNDWLRRDAERRLAQLRALDEIDALQKRADAYAKRAGQPATSWATLVRAGAVPGMMADPSGTPYELTPDGLVRLSSTSPLWPPPNEEPHTPGGAKPPS
jgi:hypothetical protein